MKSTWNREQGVGGRETKIVKAQMKVLEPKWYRIYKEDPCKTQRTSTLNVLQGLSFVEIIPRSRKRQNETRKRSNAFNSPHYLVSFRTQKALLLFICWMVCLTVKPSLVRSCSNRTIWPDGTNNPNKDYLVNGYRQHIPNSKWEPFSRLRRHRKFPK